MSDLRKGRNINDIKNMTSKDHVFRSLENILEIVRDSPNLNRERESLARSLKNVISWEPLVMDVTDEEETQTK